MNASEKAVVDVIVVTWNNAELVIDCLEHIAASTVPHRMIVVDNASQDDTIARIEADFPQATIIALDENIGYGRAVNRGAAAGEAEFIALVNNDANIEPDFLELTLAALADASVGMAGGVSLSPAGKVDAAGIMLDRGLGGYLYKVGAEPVDVDVADPHLYSPAHVTIVYRRETFDQAGGFDEEIFAYCEEVDLSMRVRRAGWNFAIVPNANAVHLGSVSIGTRSPAQIRLAAWGRGYVAGRYRVAPQWVLTEFCVGLVDMLKQRNAAPLSQRIAGWRRGRKLPRRLPPEGVEYLTWREGMRLRLRAM
jgi:N-acetylglucosaminyl-diphospho-decaprenol L-rhamnosyltransferase